MPGKENAVDGAITIVLADDHAVVRGGLKMLLDAEPDLDVIAETEDRRSTQRTVRLRRPRVLVLDLRMPGASPSTDIPGYLELSPETAIVVLTMDDDPITAREMLRAGASGYVLKQSAERQLVEAIRAAAAGRAYINPELGAELAKGAEDPLERLSDRERKLLELAALGHTNKEIGERLHFSTRAVEVKRSRLQKTLGIESRTALVRFALEHRLIEADGEEETG
ncbi:MAG: response regulator transcription factor [Solirubrobacterales bacterium]